MTEYWLPIPGYEGIYEVSDLGTVRSVPRTVPYRGGRSRSLSGRVIAPAVNRRNGYDYVTLHAYGKGHTFTTHHLLMLAFVGPRPPGLEVRHLDGDPSNTTLPNLVYGTRSENTLDRVVHGTHHEAVKSHCPANHPYDAVNTYVQPSRPGARFCRKCRAERNRLRKEAAKSLTQSEGAHL